MQSHLQQINRPFIIFLGPIIVGGIAVMVLGTLAQYTIRTIRTMNQNQSNDDNDVDLNKTNEKTKQNTSTSPSNESYALTYGIDIGSSYSKISTMHNKSISLLQNHQGHIHIPSIITRDNDGMFHVGSVAHQAR